MASSRNWIAPEGAADDEPLQVVKALPPSILEGRTHAGSKYNFQLSLNRSVSRPERDAIQSNPFGINMKAERSTIFVDQSTLGEIEEIALQLNDYLRAESTRAIEEEKAREARMNRLEAQRFTEEERLAQQARDIKFKQD